MSFDLAIVNNDLVIQDDGKIKVVSDTPKLRQDIIKIILTPLGSVKNHLWYGCSVNDDSIGNSSSDVFRVEKIKASVTEALERLRALQTAQCPTQRVTLAELIDSIGEINVERDLSDPRKINIVVSIFSKRLAKVEELFTIIS